MPPQLRGIECATTVVGALDTRMAFLRLYLGDTNVELVVGCSFSGFAE